MIEVHQKTNDIAASMTAETMKKLLIAIDAKTGGFFVMERATGAIVSTHFF
jgi:hypothetical protein